MFCSELQPFLFSTVLQVIHKYLSPAHSVPVQQQVILYILHLYNYLCINDMLMID